MNRSSIACATFLTLAVAACAGAAPKVARYPELGGPSWVELRSEHFVLKTDLDDRAGRQASAALEEIFAALADIGFASADRPRLEVEVVLFRTSDEASAFIPKLAGGRFYADGERDFERRPLAVLGGEVGPSTRVLLQHEIAHFFVHYYYPQAPTWLNEGLARYLETISLENGLAIVGRRPSDEYFVDAEQSDDPRLVPTRTAVKPSRLRAMTPDEFYGNERPDPDTEEGKTAAVRMHANYGSAWCLVNLLLTEPRYAEAFAAYLGWIRAGDPDEVAWGKTLGRFPQETLERDFETELVPNPMTALHRKWTPPAAAPPAVRAMGAASVHALWARLRPETPEGHAAAERDFAGARALADFDPADPEFALTEAYWMWRSKQPDRAESRLREALKRHAEDPRLWSAIAWVVMTKRKEGAGCQDPAVIEPLEEIAAHLDPIVQSAVQLDLLARVRGMQGKLDDALAYERRALKRDPGCVPCLVEANAKRRTEQVNASATATPAQPKIAASPGPGSRGENLHGRIEPTAVQNVVRASFGRLRQCYDDGLRRNCDLRGRVVTKFVIARDGSAAMVADGGSDLPDAAVVECILREFGALRFPAPDGGPVTVIYPIHFVPGD